MPDVVITGLNRDTDVTELLEGSANAYVTKPSLTTICVLAPITDMGTYSGYSASSNR